MQRWNAGAQALWDLPPERVVGKSLLRLDVGLPLDTVVLAIRDCFSTRSRIEAPGFR